MPRNASGTYSLPSGNPVSSGTLIDANWANNTLNDLANEVTDSLSRSAEGGMLAPLRLTDGVQATPSLAFTNEPSTGLYRAGTNDAWFVSGGNQVMQFTSSGVVGRLAAGAVGTPSLTFFGDLNTGLWSPAADTLAASTGGSERLRVDSSGNLGIGTASPAQRLHVNGDIQQENANYLRGKLAAGTATRLFGLNSANSLYVGGIDASQSEILFVRGGTTQMTLDSSGNLGIGGVPANRLDVVGDQNSSLTSRVVNINAGGSAGSRLRLENASAPWDISNSRANSSALTFEYNNAEQMRLTNSGNLGIGTSSPGKNLEVAAATDTTIRIRNTTTNLSSAVYGTLDWATSDTSAPGGIVAKIDTFDDFPGGGGFGDRAAVRFFTNNGTALAERARITSVGSFVAGAQAALATTATDGFLYVPTCAGTPTGTPTAITGMAPIVVNTTNNKLYFYSGGAWRDAGP